MTVWRCSVARADELACEEHSLASGERLRDRTIMNVQGVGANSSNVNLEPLFLRSYDTHNYTQTVACTTRVRATILKRKETEDYT